MALSVSVDNVLRLGAAIVVVVVGAGPELFSVTILLGFAVAFWWPSALTFARHVDGHRVNGFGADFAGFVGASLIAQLLLNEGPVVVALLGGSDREVTAMFAVFAIARAPTLIAGFVSVILTRQFAQWFRLGRGRLVARARNVIGAAVAIASVGAAAFAAIAGPPLVRVVFGSDVDVPSEVAVPIVAGCILALGVLALTLLLVTEHRGVTAFVAAAGGMLVCGLAIAFESGSISHRVALAFLLAEVATFFLLFVFTASRRAP
jgi:hypothetical protein